MNDAELVQLFIQTAPIAFFDLLAAGALGGIIIAFICECVATIKRKAFLDKLAQQLTAMSLWTLLLATGAGIAAYFIGASKLPGLHEWALARTSPALPLFATLGFTIFSLSLYKSTWRNLRQKKGPHLYLGTFAALGAVLTVYTGIAAMTAFAARFLAETSVELSLLDVCAPAGNTPFWPITLGAIFLCLSYGGGLGAAYLVHRRTRDDFGRDYYNYALPQAVRWAIFPVVGAAIAGAWLAQLVSIEIGMLLIKHPLVCYAGSAGTAALLALVCWLPLSISKQPLRMKGLALMAPLLLWGIHAVILFGVLVLYPLT